MVEPVSQFYLFTFFKDLYVTIDVMYFQETVTYLPQFPHSPS